MDFRNFYEQYQQYDDLQLALLQKISTPALGT